MLSLNGIWFPFFWIWHVLYLIILYVVVGLSCFMYRVCCLLLWTFKICIKLFCVENPKTPSELFNSVPPNAIPNILLLNIIVISFIYCCWHIKRINCVCFAIIFPNFFGLWFSFILTFMFLIQFDYDSYSPTLLSHSAV